MLGHHSFPAPPRPLQVRCGPTSISCYGSLLQLRGTEPGRTPLTDAAGNVLLFNGQIFGGGVKVPPATNDAAALLRALGQPGADVPAVLTSLQGPWALAYWQAATRTLWFGRDPIGEQSKQPRASQKHPQVNAHMKVVASGRNNKTFLWLRAGMRADLPLHATRCALPQAAAACCCTRPAPAMAGSC